MTTTTKHSSLRTLSLSDLTLSDMNPRQTVTDDEIAVLAQSIRSVGLIQPLAGYESGGHVEIVAGGRRLRALTRIAEDAGTDPAAVEVPVTVTTCATEARAWAGAENTARSQPNPADEIVAYRDMETGGIPVEQIAKAFAVTVRHVRGRLRLASLAPRIIEALRSGDITLDTAAAYTVTGDQEAQAEVFNRLAGGWQMDNAQTIRRMLTSDTRAANDRLCRFVGRDAYEAAGGAIREDLFGDDVWFLDESVVIELATAKLEAARAEIEADGWAWVETGIERVAWDTFSAFGRVYPSQADVSDEDECRYDELADLIESGDATDEDREAFDALDERLGAETYSAEQMAHAGVVLHIEHDGTIGAVRGLVRPEDRKAAETAGACAPDRSSRTTALKGPYPAAVLDDMTAIRTGAIQTALLNHPDLALDLLAFALCGQVQAWKRPVQVRTEDAQNAPKDHESLRLPKALGALPYPADDDGTPADRFRAWRRKAPKTRTRLLTEAIARALPARLARDGDALVELIAEMTGASVRSIWTPDAAFLKRLSKDQLLAAHQEIMGLDTPAAGFEKATKKAVVDTLAGIFAGRGRDQLSAEQAARAAAWTPDGMESVSDGGDPDTGD